jgi:hypothetical protein
MDAGKVSLETLEAAQVSPQGMGAGSERRSGSGGRKEDSVASQTGGSVNPIYAMRESLDLQTKIKEAKVLGYSGAKTDIIQKLTVTPPPSGEELTAPPKYATKGSAANGKYGFVATSPADVPKKKEAAPARAVPVMAANVYRETKGFAAVA